MGLLRSFPLLLLLSAALSVTAQAADKSAVSPSVLSLPSGPGSIEGLGESFEPQLNSGTASYSVPLETPPGRAGFAPEIALSYNSGYGNGPFGMGWRLSPPYLQRQTDKGLPRYTDHPTLDGIDNDQDGQTDEPDEWDTIIYSNGEELVAAADGSYRMENEGEFIRFTRIPTGGWKGQRPDGIIMTFGTQSASRVESGARVFRWLVDQMTDLNGNTIAFRYAQPDLTTQRYLSRIEYNRDMAVAIDYEPRPDLITDYRPRFELRTAFRATQIRMESAGSTVRTYRLGYHPVNDNQPVSQLASVTQVGRDGLSTLPPASFTYTQFSAASAQPKAMPGAPSVSLNDGTKDLVDIDGNGLPDILDASDTLHGYYLNLGPDETGAVRWSQLQEMIAQPARLDLGSDTVQLADLDGDGRSDILNLYSTEAQTYQLENRPNGMAWTTGPLIPQAYFHFNDANTKLVDLNNDKRIDVLRSQGYDLYAWINLPNRWSAAYVLPIPNSNLQFQGAGVRLADMNGDRLQDIVWLGMDFCVYYPSLGFGEFGPPISFDNPPYSPNIARTQLLDVNGDGLADAVTVSTSQVTVQLNLGLDPANPAQARFGQSFTVPAPYTDSTTVFRQADINGSGSQDLLWNTYPNGGDETFAYLDFAPSEQPYLLKTITNGIGLTTTISYRSSTQDWVRDHDQGAPWPENIPFPVPVIAKVEVNDGLQTYVTEYRYHDGYYDGIEKEFRGFAGAEKQEIGDANIPDLISDFRYDTGVQHKALKGKPLSLRTGPPTGGDYFTEDYTWQVKQLAPADPVGRTIAFPYQSKKLRAILEQGRGTPVSLRWDYEYDDYGNLTRQYEYGRLDDGWDDERVTTTRYSADYPSGLAAWLLALPVESSTTDENGLLAARTRSYYDGSLALGAVTKGNPTRTEQWIEADRYAVTDRRDYDAYGNVTAIYDALYGSQPGHYRTIDYDPNYHTYPVAEHIYTGERTLTVSAAYDTALGAVTDSTDFNGYHTGYGHDTFGRLTSITKPLDTLHTVEYDYVLAHPLTGGKLVNWVETRQLETASGGYLQSRTFFDGLARAVMTRAEGEDPGQIVVSDTVQYNARRLPHRRYLPYFEQGTLDYTAPTFASAYTEHQYDALGREIRMTQPDGSFAETLYTPLGRTLKDEEQTNPSSPHYGAAMRYVHDGLLDKDGQGRLSEVYEVNIVPGEEWKTQYSYNLLDKFTGYIDSQNNRKFVEYDGLGRQSFMNDPDRGHYYWTNDDAGNLIQTKDAKAQIIRYAYDGANRTKAEYWGAESQTPEVEYHYDQPAGPVNRGEFWPNEQATAIAQTLLQEQPPASGQDRNDDGQIDAADLVSAARAATVNSAVTAQNTLGHLAWVRDQSGEEHTSYDARGRVNWVVKRIIGETADQLHNFYSGMEYDPMDRVARRIYPDSTYVDYRFNSRGLLESIPNVIDRLDYNPVGQNSLISRANGVLTQQEYDIRQRPFHLITTRQRDGLTLQDLNYRFDAVSNITSITDARTDQELDNIGAELGITAEEAQKFRASQDFRYDNLYRLTFAANPAVWGTIEHVYDRIGNMIRQDATLINDDPLMNFGVMSYGGPAGAFNQSGSAQNDAPGPHALTAVHVGSETQSAIAYDENGNVIIDSGKVLEWDAKDQLTGVSGVAGSRGDYHYDYRGSRTGKSTAGTAKLGQVLYISDQSEIRDGTLLNYIAEDGTRMAQSAGMNSSNQPFDPRGQYLQDHQFSSVFLLAPSGQIDTHSINYPFGLERQQYAAPNSIGSMPYRYTGKESDAESGFSYFGARYLGTNAGRFISVDPLAMSVSEEGLVTPQALNPFSYSLNNPNRYFDPDGEFAHIIAGAAVGAVFGFAGETINQAISGNYNGKQLLAATLGGAAGGGVAAATGGASLLATIGSNVLSNVSAGVVSRAVTGEKQSLSAVGGDTISAIIGLAQTKFLSGAVSRVSRHANTATEYILSKNGTKVPASQRELKSQILAAGGQYMGKAKSGIGERFKMSTKYGELEIRIMEGTPNGDPLKGRRSVFVVPDTNQPLHPDGQTIKGNPTQNERRDIGHIHGQVP